MISLHFFSSEKPKMNQYLLVCMIVVAVVNQVHGKFAVDFLLYQNNVLENGSILILIDVFSHLKRNLGKCDGGYWCCGGDYLCGQGEGDCDNDGECLPGLKCDFDGWWGRDYCTAGMP